MKLVLEDGLALEEQKRKYGFIRFTISYYLLLL